VLSAIYRWREFKNIGIRTVFEQKTEGMAGDCRKGG
jgi:hypothetical protein